MALPFGQRNWKIDPPGDFGVTIWRFQQEREKEKGRAISTTQTCLTRRSTRRRSMWPEEGLADFFQLWASLISSVFPGDVCFEIEPPAASWYGEHLSICGAMWIPRGEEKLVFKNASDGKSEGFSNPANCRVADLDYFSSLVAPARSASKMFAKNKSQGPRKLIKLVGPEQKNLMATFPEKEKNLPAHTKSSSLRKQKWSIGVFKCVTAFLAMYGLTQWCFNGHILTS